MMFLAVKGISRNIVYNNFLYFYHSFSFYVIVFKKTRVPCHLIIYNYTFEWAKLNKFYASLLIKITMFCTRTCHMYRLFYSKKQCDTWFKIYFSKISNYLLNIIDFFWKIGKTNYWTKLNYLIYINYITQQKS